MARVPRRFGAVHHAGGRPADLRRDRGARGQRRRPRARRAHQPGEAGPDLHQDGPDDVGAARRAAAGGAERAVEDAGRRGRLRAGHRHRHGRAGARPPPHGGLQRVRRRAGRRGLTRAGARRSGGCDPSPRPRPDRSPNPQPNPQPQPQLSPPPSTPFAGLPCGAARERRCGGCQGPAARRAVPRVQGPLRAPPRRRGLPGAHQALRAAAADRLRGAAQRVGGWLLHRARLQERGACTV